MDDTFAFLTPFARELAAINVGQAAPNSEYKLRTYSPYNLRDEKSFRRWDRAEDLRDMVAQIESENNPSAIGDTHLKNKAYGLYQFRQPAIDEVNKMLAINDVNKRYTLNDMLDRDKATEAFRLYTYYNAQNLEKQLGREPTDIELMVAHNTSFKGVPAGMLKTNDSKSYVSKAAQPVPGNNDAKDAYIEKVESVASDAAAGVLAVQERLPADDIKRKVLEAQSIRLSGVKEPSVAKLEEHRRTIANNDTKSAAKDKAEAVKVDKETSELYAKVAALDKKLSDAKASEEKAIALAKQATKNESIWYVTALGCGMLAVGIFVAAFTPKKIAGGIVVAGGMLCASSAWIFESEIYSWVLLGTGALVIVNVGAAATFAVWRFVKDRFFQKSAGHLDG